MHLPEFDPPPDDREGARAAEKAKPGDTFDRYEIEGVLGEGAAGVVYRARDARIRRTVALKVLRPELHLSANLLARFQREAELAGRLRHPSIVTVYEHGVHEGKAYTTMEFVEARTVRDLLQERKRFPPSLALHIAVHVGRALDYAHEHGVIHRDVKPSNILLAGFRGSWWESDPETVRVLVTDFGVARDLTAATQLTQSGTMIGTPTYMAPEQTGSHASPVDGRADQYALGTVLYETLTGRPPFPEENVHRLLLRIATEDPEPIRRRVPTLDRDLETIVMKTLSKDPRRRYPSCGAMVEDLIRLLRGEPILARPRTRLEMIGRWVRRHRLATATGAVSIFLLAATVLYFTVLRPSLSRRREEERLAVKAREKIELESRVRAWLQEARAAWKKGRPDRCLEICDRIEETALPLLEKEPAPPRLARKDARFAPLLRPYRFPLAQTYYLRALASDTQGHKDRTLSNLALAIHTALLAGGEEASVAKEALMRLGSLFEKEGKLDRAVGAYRAIRRRFPGTKEAARASLRLAVCLALREEYGNIRGRLERIRFEEDRLAPPERRTFRRLSEVMGDLLPVRETIKPAGVWTLGDLTGDGRTDWIQLEPSGHLSVADLGTGQERKIQLLPATDLEDGETSLHCLDLNGDGKNELVVFHGNAWSRRGFFSIYRWDDPPRRLHHEPLPANGAECWIATGDLDGDGIRETIAGISYFSRQLWIGRLQEDRWTPLDRISLGADPLSLLCLDLDRTRGEEILLSTGGWKFASGFRVSAFRWSGPGKMKRLSTLPVRTHAQTLTRVGGNIYFHNTHEPKHREVLAKLSRTERLLPAGVFRLPTEGGKIGRPEPVSREGAALHDARKEVLLLSDRHAQLRFPDGTALPLGAATGRYFFVEADGDAGFEILRVREGRTRTIALFGVLKKEKETPPPSEESATVLRFPVLAAVEELLALGFHEEAVRLCLSPRAGRSPEAISGWLEIRRGDALRELGREEEALRAYRSAGKKSPAVAWTASLAELDLLEASRRWREFSDRAGAILESLAVPPRMREELKKRREGAREMSALETVVSMDAPGLLVEDPTLLRREGAEWIWHAPAVGRASHFVPFRYSGASLRLRGELRFERSDWETGLSLSFVRLLSLDPPRVDPAALLRLHVRFTGSSLHPVREVSLVHRHPSEGASLRRIVHASYDKTEAWSIRIEYVRHLRLLVGSLRRGKDPPVLFRLERVAPLPAGTYGLVLESGAPVSPGPEFFTTVRVREWSLQSRGGPSPILLTSPSALPTLLFRAHGLWAQGETHRAKALLARGRTMRSQQRMSGVLPATLFSLLTRGMMDSDPARMRSALQSDPLSVLHWFAGRRPFLPKETRDTLRSVLWEAASKTLVTELLERTEERSPPFAPAVRAVRLRILALLEKNEPEMALAAFLLPAFESTFTSWAIRSKGWTVRTHVEVVASQSPEVRVGDRIAEVDGHPVTSEREVRERIQTAGRRVRLRLDRAGSGTIEVSIPKAGLDLDFRERRLIAY